ncbi:FadR/GntR family transcriptional regulator [Pseudomonas aeruginosa]|uniref:FadR/GntR family transcriptional regulator n=1 Tax=Pseudomonas aeruginosa TaxID=287 RepID=UPI003D9C41C4
MTIPLKRSPVDIALEQIRQRIDAGHWPLGQRLPPEPELAELLGMEPRHRARSGARADLSGVLEVRQGDGTYVRACADPLELMLVLARSAVQHPGGTWTSRSKRRAWLPYAATTATWSCALREHLDASRQRYGSADLLDYIEHDVRFHQRMVDAAHNPVRVDANPLPLLLAGHLRGSRRNHDHVDLAGGGPQPCFELHQQLLDAIERETRRCCCANWAASPT